MYHRVSFLAVNLFGDFWEKRQDINREVTMPAIRDRFEQTGRFHAFEMIPLSEGGIKPHIFWDSDVAKWMESAAYILEKHTDNTLIAQVDAVVDLIEKHQDENGYFNLYFTVVEPDKRFQRRDDHELYCAGHLIEAAVAYAQATGKTKFLDLMKKYVSCIEKAFVQEHTAAFCTPGHEEIELALYKLYRYTGEKKYLDLALHFINQRGTIENEKSLYNQSHLPVRQQSTAEGHSVRACYLYAAMADLAYETRDEELYNSCKKLFDNIYQKRCYITGGVGSSRHGEAFTVDYDLPNAEAYAETCAAIALAFFASRMQRFSPDPAYADIIERILYNGMLSGVSLDGKSFFYENPLEILHSRRGRNVSVSDPERFPSARRQEVFDCSCCPPNITRFIASVADYLYTYSDDAIYVHQYMSGVANFSIGERAVRISQKTNYPVSGQIDIVAKNIKGMCLAVRIPLWCDDFSIYIDGGKRENQVRDGYLYITAKSEVLSLTLNLSMKPRLIYSDARNAEDAALCALGRGPLIYCMESCDNQIPLRSIQLLSPLQTNEFYNQDLDCIQITARALVVESQTDCGALYYHQPKYRQISSEWIPYYAFANREECDMLVWSRYQIDISKQ